MSSKNPSDDEPESERPERGPTDHSYTAHTITPIEKWQSDFRRSSKKAAS